MADGTVMLRTAVEAITDGMAVPEGYDRLGFRAVRPDFRSSRGFTWPFPGQVATAPGPVLEYNKGPCPAAVGDGLCVALTMRGMASGRVVASTVLVVAYRDADVVGADHHKVRVRQALVVVVLDVPRMAREGDLASTDLYATDWSYTNLDGAALEGVRLAEANLRGANLSFADLRRADLRGANLAEASLYEAALGAADLSDAVLRGTQMGGVMLHHALLNGADMRQAALVEAQMYCANLSGAQMTRVDLRSANLATAQLCNVTLDHADLYGANLRGANLTGVDLRNVRLDEVLYDRTTVWPVGFTPPAG